MRISDWSSDVCSSDLIADARAAVETLARRADGVMHFVESYRQISRTPEVRRRVYEVLPWARELEALFRAGDAGAGVTFELDVSRDDLAIDADPDLLAQVLITLMRRSEERRAGKEVVRTFRFRRTP